MLYYFCMQSSDLPATSNPQSASDVDIRSTSSAQLESGSDKKSSSSKLMQYSAQISQESTKHITTATSKRPSLTLAASRDDSTKSDSQISSKSGQKTRSQTGTDISLQAESVHRRSPVSAVHSQTSSSNTSRSITTTHGRSSSSGSQQDRSGLQGRSSYSSRRSLSGQERSSSGQGHRDTCSSNSERCDKGSSEKLRYQQESASRSRACTEEVQRLGHGQREGHIVSRQEREWELRKYRPRERGRERRDYGASSVGKADRQRCDDSTRLMGRETQVEENLNRLSMDASGTQAKEFAEAEYQPVLTRHVNQLFVRGDNVALVAILA